MPFHFHKQVIRFTVVLRDLSTVLLTVIQSNSVEATSIVRLPCSAAQPEGEINSISPEQAKECGSLCDSKKGCLMQTEISQVKWTRL